MLACAVGTDLDTWREMLTMKKQGKVKHLGVANFTVEQVGGPS